MLTTLSGKGQVVIPQAIREKLNLKIGDNFIVAAKSNVIVLKRININSNFEDIFRLIRKTAKNMERKL